MTDISRRLVALSADRLVALHERLHKSSPEPAVIETHHHVVNEMMRRDIAKPESDAWENILVEVDILENADISNMGGGLPEGTIDSIIKSTGSHFSDVRTVLTMTGYELRFNSVEKFNQNHDPKDGQFSTGDSGGATSHDVAGAIAETGSKAWANSIADSLNAGGSPVIKPHDAGKFMEQMIKRTDNPDITKLRIKGTLLYGGEGLGIKRSEMPQIPTDMRNQFISDMAKQGIKATYEKVDPMSLKPTQNEISGSKTGRLYDHFKSDGGIPKDKAILVSQDNFVIDGHHHWAAAVTFALTGKGSKLPVIRLTANIGDALQAGLKWDAVNGIKSQTIDDLGKSLFTPWDFDEVEKFNPYHNEAGRFATAEAGDKAMSTITHAHDGITPMVKDIPAPEGTPAEVIKAVAECRQKALALEPNMTRDIVHLAQDVGAGMAGLDQRIKSTESLARKIQGDAKVSGVSVAEAGKEISDSLRYTMVIDSKNYTDAMGKVGDTLTKAGYEIRTKNFWRVGDPYQGINMKLTKGGVKVELQVHTPESFKHKESIHPIYKKWRVDANAKTSWQGNDHMTRLARRNVPHPDKYDELMKIGTISTQDFTTPSARGIVAKNFDISSEDGAKRYTLGAMYIPNRYDAHNEWTDADELQGAIWRYVQSGDRRIRLQHNKDIVAGEWVEIMAFPYEVSMPVNLSNGLTETRTYPANTVFLGVVWNEWAWQLVIAGKVNGYSIGGKAQRLFVDMPDAG